ncbi:hypothetical protein JCM10213_004369 [Rhodosporidiobolus nylandii]
MATLAAPAIDASTRLLRAASHLLLEVDPVKGGKAKALGLVVDELKDLLDHETPRLPAAVQSLLCSAITSLSSDIPTIPYPDCLYALSAISSALPLLVSPSPPRPSPFSRLPAELVAGIVDFCQDEDLRLRQNTNLTLSRTCRPLYTAVRPILAAEVHLFTAGQLEQVAKKAEQASYARLVRVLTADLSLSDIARQPDGRWAGWQLPGLVRLLGQAGSLRKVDIQLRPSGKPVEFDSFDEILPAVGLDANEWEELFYPRKSLPTVEELTLPVLSPGITERPFFRALLKPSSRLKHLRIGHPSHPHTLDRGRLARAAAAYKVWHDERGGAAKAYSSFRTLALPFFPFYPLDFVRFTAANKLEHLELCLFLDGAVNVHLAPLAELLANLAPSIRRLVLRIKRPGCTVEDASAVCGVLWPGLQACSKLEHLELGGDVVGVDILKKTGMLPSVSSFVLLPHAGDHLEAEDAAQEMKSLWRLKSFTICLPSAAPVEGGGTWSERALRILTETCRIGRTAFKIEGREKEYEWLEGDVL